MVIYIMHMTSDWYWYASRCRCSGKPRTCRGYAFLATLTIHYDPYLYSRA